MPKNQQLFFVKVNIGIDYTYYDYNRVYVFNSENAMKDFIANFENQGYTMRKIVDYGKANFIDGILCPYK